MLEGSVVCRAPRLPQRESLNERLSPFAASAVLHALGIAALLVIVASGSRPQSQVSAPTAHESVRLPPVRMVFLPARGPESGGGGGGNTQSGPIRRAERVGDDRATIPVARPLSVTGLVDTPAPEQQLVLEAKPLASGTTEQVGVLEGGVGFGTSQGPGSGGGIGEGTGTGVGSGRGPGVGPGSGGGTGGGVYRPGSGVTAPTILSQIRPSYTSDALQNKVQGTVILELIVRREGVPSDIRIVRSLDPHGLDDQAVAAVRGWRFTPGRLGGVPVDVLVTVVLDFSIR